MIIILNPPNLHQLEPVISDHPLNTLEKVYLNTRCFVKFYDHVKVLYHHIVHSQVILNHEHGFSKRFNHVEMYNFVHTCQPTLNINVLALFFKKTVEGG
jgi:hypothetical protein